MTTDVGVETRPVQELTVEQQLDYLRELFADAPEVGKKALENVLKELNAQASKAPPPLVQSAGGREPAGQGLRADDHRPLRARRSGAAARVPAAVRRQSRRRGRRGQRPRHALRVPGQRHEDALRDRL